jgi:uncharacterized membrane protein
MESHFKAAGHPVHPMLIVFPLGLLATASIFDAVKAATGNSKWSAMAHHLIGAGVVSGLLAAIPGTVDYLVIPDHTRAKRIGLLHGVGNVVVTGLFAASWFLRRKHPRRPDPKAIALSISGTALAVITGWLGGELVDRLGIGVDDGAHLNAPSSLRTPSAVLDRTAPESVA